MIVKGLGTRIVNHPWTASLVCVPVWWSPNTYPDMCFPRKMPASVLHPPTGVFFWMSMTMHGIYFAMRRNCNFAANKTSTWDESLALYHCLADFNDTNKLLYSKGLAANLQCYVPLPLSPPGAGETHAPTPVGMRPALNLILAFENGASQTCVCIKNRWTGGSNLASQPEVWLSGWWDETLEARHIWAQFTWSRDRGSKHVANPVLRITGSRSLYCRPASAVLSSEHSTLAGITVIWLHANRQLSSDLIGR